MAKDTKLESSADIYQPRAKQTERQKLSDMTFKDKITYFNQYYRLKTIVLIGSLVCIIYLIYTILSPKVDTVFYAAIYNNYLDEDKKTEFCLDFGDFLNIDPKKSNINLDTSYIDSNDALSAQSVLASQQKLTTYSFSQQIDVIIAPEDTFKTLAYNGYFSDLADQLPTDLYSHFADSLYLSTQEEDTEVKAYGISLTDSEVFDSLGNQVEKPVLGIVANSKYKKNSIEFLRYIFRLY